jgi:hypothetical protein
LGKKPVNAWSKKFKQIEEEKYDNRLDEYLKENERKFKPS